MQFDWLALLLGWVGGIPSGIVANYLFNRITGRKRKIGEYFTTNYTSGSLEFEGRIKTRISAEEVIQKFLEQAKFEENTENQSV